jgi:hypothetical protein
VQTAIGWGGGRLYNSKQDSLVVNHSLLSQITSQPVIFRAKKTGLLKKPGFFSRND